MSLSLQISQDIDVQDVVAIAEQAAAVILQVGGCSLAARPGRAPGRACCASGRCSPGLPLLHRRRPPLPYTKMWARTDSAPCAARLLACSRRPAFTCPLPTTTKTKKVYESGDWEVQAKADDSPLTRADREANAVICAGLARIGVCGGVGGVAFLGGGGWARQPWQRGRF